MKNIFENTYFGKPYKTMGGKRALYCMESEGIHYLIVDGWCDTIAYNNDGSIWNILKNNIDDVIVSEWQEEINEVELDKLAIEEKKKYKEQLPFYYEFPHSESDLNIRCMGYIDGFKDCYRKVIEKYGFTQNDKN